MPLAIYTSAAWTANGGLEPASQALVTVRNEATGALASIFSDRSGNNGLGNPFNADDQGRFSFYASGGAYRIEVESDGLTQELRYQAIGTSAEYDLAQIQAIANSGVYETTADGLADTTDGDYFWVPSDDTLDLYQNDAGSADKQDEYPNLQLINTILDEAVSDAEDARDAAQQAGNVYDSTADGIAGTSDGDYFSVPEGGDLVLYQNDNGSAVEVSRFSSATVLEGDLASSDTGEGASLVSMENGDTVEDYLQTNIAETVDSVATLRASSFPANLERLWLSGYYGVGTAGGGPLYRSSGTDDGGTKFEAGDGSVWERPPSRERLLTEFGAIADGTTAATDNHDLIVDALQNADSQGGGIVRVPYSGDGEYRSTKFSFFEMENVTLVIDDHVTFRMIDDEDVNDQFVKFDGTNSPAVNCHIHLGFGSTIRRQGGYTTGEQRHGVRFRFCDNCSVVGKENSKVGFTGGDGFYFAYQDGTSTPWPKNAVVRGVQSVQNRRQGYSVISGDVTIELSEGSETSGTAPTDGIDIEPNADFYLGTVNIKNFTSRENDGRALQVFMDAAPTDGKVEINVDGLYSYGDGDWGIEVGDLRDRTDPLTLNVRGLYVKDPPEAGMRFRNVGSNNFISVHGTVDINNNSWVIQTEHNGEAGFTGSPNVYADITVMGSDVRGLLEDTSNNSPSGHSDNYHFIFRNRGLAQSVSIGEEFTGKLEPVDFVEKTFTSSTTVVPPDTGQGVRVLTNEGAASQTTLTLDDSRYRIGSIVKLRSEANDGVIIDSTDTSAVFFPAQSGTYQTSQRRASATLEKISDSPAEWIVREETGSWS